MWFWLNGAKGNPQPGMMYTQALVPVNMNDPEEVARYLQQNPQALGDVREMPRPGPLPGRIPPFEGGVREVPIGRRPPPFPVVQSEPFAGNLSLPLSSIPPMPPVPWAGDVREIPMGQIPRPTLTPPWLPTKALTPPPSYQSTGWSQLGSQVPNQISPSTYNTGFMGQDQNQESWFARVRRMLANQSVRPRDPRVAPERDLWGGF